MNRVRHAAFSLVEVTLALGVAACCLIVVFGLLPVGLRSNQAAVEQTTANGILSAVAADLRATRPPTSAEITGNTAVVSQQFGISIPVNPVASSPTIAPALYFTSAGQVSSLSGNSRYRLTVAFLPNGSSNTKMRPATFVNLQVSWPAAAPANVPAGPVPTFLNAAGFVVALDRN